MTAGLSKCTITEWSIADHEDNRGRRGDAGKAREDPRDETRDILLSPSQAEAAGGHARADKWARCVSPFVVLLGGQLSIL